MPVGRTKVWIVAVLVAAAAIAVPATSATAAGTPTEQYVHAVYADFLGRAPTANELSATTDGLDSGVTTMAGVVGGLARSPEYVTSVVQKMYRDTLGRDGDPGGLTYWSTQIRKGARTVASVAANLYASDEYFNGIGGGTVPSWLTDLYRKVLLRDPDSGGLAYWEDQTAKTNRVSVALRFFQSSESTHTRVANLYHALLGRAPDAGGWDYWAARVYRDGDLSLAANLAVSPEYVSRAHYRFQLAITTTILNRGVTGAPYLLYVGFFGGLYDQAHPYPKALTFSATGLPPGLSITKAGVIQGTPTTTGTFQVTLKVADVLEPTSTDQVTLPLPVAAPAPPGCQPSGACSLVSPGNYSAELSNDGRYVLFTSASTDLVALPDANNNLDVFLRDRTTGTTTRISSATAGTASRAADMSADGRYVAWISTFGGADHLYRWDRTTGASTPIVTAPNLQGALPFLSGDGSTIAFTAYDPSLPGGDTSTAFVWRNGTLSPIPAQSEWHDDVVTGISDSGDLVTFEDLTTRHSDPAANVYDVWVYDRVHATATHIASTDFPVPTISTISGDGSVVVFWSEARDVVPGDSSRRPALYAWTRSTATVTRLPVSAWDFIAQNVVTSPDGRYVGFTSGDDNLVAGKANAALDAFLFDRSTGTLQRLTNGDHDSYLGDLTLDGATVVINSLATNLVSPPTTTPAIVLWTRPG